MAKEDSDFLDQVKRELDFCLGKIGSSQSAFLSTLDGHLLVSRSKCSLDVEALCPITGSLIGVAEAMAGQMGQGDLYDAIIRTEEGVLATIKLNDARDSLLLGISALRKVNLGMLVTQGKNCAEKIRQIIEP